VLLVTDEELIPWVYGILHSEPTRPGTFLSLVAQAAVRADVESYASLRSGLLQLRKRFPKYECKCEKEVG
jgi:hypothetical protein